MADTKSKQNNRQSKNHESSYKAYRGSGRREINKAKRLAKHLKRFPWHAQAHATLKGTAASILSAAKVKVPELEMSPVVERRELGVTLTQQKRVIKQVMEAA